MVRFDSRQLSLFFWLSVALSRLTDVAAFISQPLLQAERAIHLALDDEVEDKDEGSMADHLLAVNVPLIPVLLETDHLLVIDKPTGIPHHSTEEELGILALLRAQQASGKLDYKGRLYGVHRLDRVTSGILVLAKDSQTATHLTKAFRERSIVKYYTGISSRKAKQKQGWIRGSMQKGRRKSWYLVRPDGTENYAETRFFTAGLGGLEPNAAARTLLLFRPHTVRTHQLRVAAKSVGLPLLGDDIYSDGSVDMLSRTCLHATALHLPSLDVLEALTIYSPPPFCHLWHTTEAQSGFMDALQGLFQKHCDCEPILEVVMDQAAGRGAE